MTTGKAIAYVDGFNFYYGAVRKGAGGAAR